MSVWRLESGEIRIADAKKVCLRNQLDSGDMPTSEEVLLATLVAAKTSCYTVSLTF